MESQDTLHATVLVNADAQKTYYAFAQQMTSWWPREYTWSNDYLGHIVLEAETNGAWYETDGAGVRQPDWGTVLLWEPPQLLRLSWAISAERKAETSPEHRSEITLRFTSQDEEATLVELEHSGFSRHGAEWEAYRNAMAGPDGWPKILEAFAAFAGRSEGEALLGLGSEDDGTKAPFADASSTVPHQRPTDNETPAATKLAPIAMAGVGAVLLLAAMRKIRKRRRLTATSPTLRSPA